MATVYVAMVERGWSANYATADDVIEVVGVFWSAVSAAKAIKDLQAPENTTWVETHEVRE